MKKQNGFSLIELLVVVAVILIISGIAIPNLMRSRMAANESSAVGSMRAISAAEQTYSSAYGIGFAPLANLGGANPCTASPATACLLDPVLSGGAKSGYNFATPLPAAPGTVAAPNVIFVANGVPISLGQSGQRSFCTDLSGVIRNDPTGVTAAATVAACQALTPIE